MSQPIARLLSRIEDDTRKYLAAQSNATLVVGISIEGERQVRSFRSPDTEKVPLPDVASMYEIGSFSKVFSTSVLAVLEARGVVSLDDTIRKYLPPSLDLPPEIARITVRQLATHTSGLDRVGKVFAKMIYEDVRTCYLRYRKEDLYEELRIAQLAYPSGQGWEYSIIGMGLLGHIMELATGSSYEALLKSTICAPLGLADTGYTLSDDQITRMVRAIDSDGLPTANWYHDVLMPQGGLRSTMQDMLTFAEANLAARFKDDGSTLSKALRRTREQHFEWPRGHQLPTRELGEFVQALAWWRIPVPTGQAWWHNGATMYYQSAVGVSDAAPVAVVALTSYYRNLLDIETFPALQREWLRQACR
ncbi:MAG: serine hydrolase domain-containing protein [Chloroflexota bacterium]